MYPTVTVPNDASELPEQLGTKFKFWYRDHNRRMLFKQGRPGTGENWAEKVCAEIAALLGLPHAPYDLAVWQGLHGVITPTCAGGRTTRTWKRNHGAYRERL